MLIYLSGPISPGHGFTTAQNVAQALDVYFAMIRHKVWPVCPHLAALTSGDLGIDYERWMEYDFALIDACSHVLMLPRWETSSGACREREYAERIGKTVLYEMPEFA